MENVKGKEKKYFATSIQGWSVGMGWDSLHSEPNPL